MRNEEIKIKAWEKTKGYLDSNDNDFNASATSFKIADNYNLVVWCDIDYENSEGERYFIVSIRENDEDDLFGDDIGFEACTNGISKEELENAIDYLTNKLKG